MAAAGTNYPYIEMAFSVIGHDHLVGVFEGMKIGVRNRIFRHAFNDVLKPFVNTVKSNTPVRSGLMQKSMALNIKNVAGTSVVGALIGARQDVSTTVPKGYKTRRMYKLATALGLHKGEYRPAAIVHIVNNGRKKFAPFPGRFFLEKSWNQDSTMILSRLGVVLYQEIVKEALAASAAGKSIYKY